MTPLLTLSGVHKAYGRTPVIRGLDLTVADGEFVGVIGPNGAGKTTAFGLIAGHLRCDSGTIQLQGQDITALSADERCRAGIGRTFQIPQPFAGLSVYENTLVAATYGAGLDQEPAADAACDALRRCGLSAQGNQPAGGLTLLQRKRLEVARALATSPKLLLLDEVGGGLTVLWIEHLVHALVKVARRLVVLTDGSLLADGPPAEVIASRLVRETYLGSELEMEAEVEHAAG
jgi:branched-chain amino acid transport system ATP-binding protein